MATDQEKVPARDPVCGMSVDPSSAKARADHAGNTYYFCCMGCAQKFQAAPEEYLKPKPSGLVTLGVPPPRHDSHSPLAGISASPTPVTGDPVCGMTVNPQTAKHRTEHGGSTFFFCSASCVEKFKANPDAYLTSRNSRQSQSAQLTMASTAYVCPMCPEVRESKPVP